MNLESCCETTLLIIILISSKDPVSVPVSYDVGVCSMGVRLVWVHFTNHLFIGDLIFPIHRDFSVSNKFKSFRPPDSLVVCSISYFTYPLAQASQFIGVRRIPDPLVFGMFLQLSVFKVLSRFFVHYRHCSVKDTVAQVPSA